MRDSRNGVADVMGVGDAVFIDTAARFRHKCADVRWWRRGMHGDDGEVEVPIPERGVGGVTVRSEERRETSDGYAIHKHRASLTDILCQCYIMRSCRVAHI